MVHTKSTKRTSVDTGSLNFITDDPIFMGYVLPWGQMSFWGATVITNLFSAIPLVGENIVTWLWGGFSVDNATLNRFFSLHFVLPFVIVGVVILHLIALHRFGSNNPIGIDVKGKQDTIPFHPYYTIKDLFGLGIFLTLFSQVRSIFSFQTSWVIQITIFQRTLWLHHHILSQSGIFYHSMQYLEPFQINLVEFFLCLVQSLFCLSCLVR